MKGFHKISLILFFLLLCTLSFASNESAEADTSCMELCDAGTISSQPFPTIPSGDISSGIAVPAQPLMRTNNTNNLLRVIASSRLMQGGSLCCFVRSSGSQFKLYDLSTPFYCTPPCEYYIFALERLII